MDKDKLVERIEEDADMLLARADRLWGWRRRDKALSITVGDMSRSLRLVAAALRSHDSEMSGAMKRG